MRIAVPIALLVIAGLAYGYNERLFGHGRAAGVSVTGTIEAIQVDVSVKITGRIVKRLVEEGDPIAKGQLLVSLDDTELVADVRRQQAVVQTADATLRDLLRGARPEEIEEARAVVARARAQLEDLLAGSRAQEVEDAKMAVESARASRLLKERELQRLTELHRKDLISLQDLDRAREAYEVTSAQERGAREKLSMTVEGPRRHQIEAARAEMAAAERRLALLLAGSRPDQIEAARGQLAQARSTLAVLESRLRESTVVSPINGLVLRKNLEVGETANPGVSILTLMDPREIWVRAYVPETQIGHVKIGQEARVTIDGHPGRAFAGRVKEIASEAEYTPKNVQTKKERVNLVYRIKVTVDNRDGILKPGMVADVDVGA
jgi:HlyD family secretion protein